LPFVYNFSKNPSLDYYLLQCSFLLHLMKGLVLIYDVAELILFLN